MRRTPASCGARVRAAMDSRPPPPPASFWPISRLGQRPRWRPPPSPPSIRKGLPQMSDRLTLPDSAATAQPAEDGRLFAPSAARNSGDIATLLAHHAPARGRALELASGTGEHAVVFARRMPALDWQPSD